MIWSSKKKKNNEKKLDENSQINLSEKKYKAARVLLIDDDTTYGMLMRQVAIQSKVNLTYCKDITEFGLLENWDFDAVLMDYDLGFVNGLELTSYYEDFSAKNTPVVLISHTQREISKDTPDSIKKFMHKSIGPYLIMQEALRMDQEFKAADRKCKVA